MPIDRAKPRMRRTDSGGQSKRMCRHNHLGQLKLQQRQTSSPLTRPPTSHPILFALELSHPLKLLFALVLDVVHLYPSHASGLYLDPSAQHHRGRG